MERMESVASKNVSDVGGSGLKRLGSSLAGPPNNTVFSALFDCTMAGLQDRLALAPPKVNQAEQDAAEAMQVSVGTFAVVLLHVPFRYVDHSCCRAGGAARDRACLAIAELSVGQLCSDFSR